jgi:hypothetical protein
VLLALLGMACDAVHFHESVGHEQVFAAAGVEVDFQDFLLRDVSKAQDE